ncbi:MAG TPA: hypothetical protein VNK49_00215 [Anaerolineales bacterium]|nr:hypothetical protein [Anaerolineales bacterium]
MEPLICRRIGFVLGLVLGLAYGTVSNLINRIYMPDIPLYVPPPGVSGLIVMTTLLFALQGLLAA